MLCCMCVLVRVWADEPGDVQLAAEPESARQWFEKSLTHSKRVGSRDGVAQSTEALRLLKVPVK